MIGADGDMFLQLGLVVIGAAVLAFGLRLLKQPQILAYVFAGILITPVFKLITNTSVIESMSIIGIAFLLFIVGIEMDIKSLKTVSLVSSLGGLIEIIILFVSGYFISLLLGFLPLEAAYIGLMIAFSSTMVVMKLLSDKRELNTLHGRIIVGTLLIQDIVAIFAISILVSINDFSFLMFGIAFIKFISLFLLAYIASKFIFPSVFRFAAKRQELLLISSLAVCFIFSLAFQYVGFSIAIGAFIAGLTLGNLEYNFEIIGKVKSLRDFFSLLFFVSLGMGLSLAVIKDMWIPLIVLIIVLIIFKPIIIMLVCSLFKYTKKPSFFTANSLAQMGEFSLILAAQGLVLGHISKELFSLTVIIVLITITITSYYIKHNQWIYRYLQPLLKIFDIFTTEGLEYLPTGIKPKIILCGHNRIGYSILQNLKKVKKKLLIVDYNPEIISMMVKKGYHCIYGEVSDEEIIERMNLREIEMLISTVPETKDNLYLVGKVRAVNKHAKVIVTASEIDEALKLYDKGADYVILPHFLGGEHASNLITELRARRVKIKEEKKKHIEALKERKEIGHEHPKNEF
ncbi:MAG: cation:proton antiporter [Nanoarchaeota archaeon]|nr:cation:proton antiporter [Nanoarchaeota archaeon]MBU1632097.1 cation:proton antiporter [Nanoarchaeota archaeon]MBU1875731.1 cation:proton antiporter [Nanoarchaeota archaeon]